MVKLTGNWVVEGGGLRFILALFGLRHKSSGRETPQQARRHLWGFKPFFEWQMRLKSSFA